MSTEEKKEFNRFLKFLIQAEIDCRKLANLKLIFLSEDKEGLRKLSNTFLHDSFREYESRAL